MFVSLSQVLGEAKKAAGPKPIKSVKLSVSKPRTPDAPKRSAVTDEGDPSKEALRKQQSQQKAVKTRELKAREAQKAGLAQSKADRLAKRAAIQQAEKERAVGKPPGIDGIPAQIAHCMMALHVKRKKSRNAAWNICRWAMTKHGYLKGPYRVNTKLPKAVTQTGKGTKRSFQHGMEKAPLDGGVAGTGTTKFKKFVTMFKTLEPTLLPKQRKAPKTVAYG
jgi:hypothetical protein